MSEFTLITDPDEVDTDFVRQHRDATGAGLFEARKSIVRDQRRNAIDVLVNELDVARESRDLYPVLRDTLLLLKRLL